MAPTLLSNYLSVTDCQCENFNVCRRVKKSPLFHTSLFSFCSFIFLLTMRVYVSRYFTVVCETCSKSIHISSVYVWDVEKFKMLLLVQHKNLFPRVHYTYWIRMNIHDHNFFIVLSHRHKTIHLQYVFIWWNQINCKWPCQEIGELTFRRFCFFVCSFPVWKRPLMFPSIVFVVLFMDRFIMKYSIRARHILNSNWKGFVFKPILTENCSTLDIFHTFYSSFNKFCFQEKWFSFRKKNYFIDHILDHKTAVNLILFLLSWFENVNLNQKKKCECLKNDYITAFESFDTNNFVSFAGWYLCHWMSFTLYIRDTMYNPNNVMFKQIRNEIIFEIINWFHGNQSGLNTK